MVPDGYTDQTLSRQARKAELPDAESRRACARRDQATRPPCTALHRLHATGDRPPDAGIEFDGSGA